LQIALLCRGIIVPTIVAYEIPCMQLLLFLTQGKCVGKAIDVIMFHKLGRGMGVAAAR